MTELETVTFVLATVGVAAAIVLAYVCRQLHEENAILRERLTSIQSRMPDTAADDEECALRW